MNNVAVIITTKNRADYLDRAFNSVINQSVPPDEIIIVDDFSDIRLGNDTLRQYNDSSLNVGAKFKYHFNESACGGNFSRNLGVKLSVSLSKSEIIMFLDDDDAWEPNKVEIQLGLFENGNSFVYTGKKFVSSDDLTKVNRKSVESESDKNIWLGNYIGSTSGVALKKELFFSAGMFDENLQSLQDFDLWIRCLKLTPAVWDGAHSLIYTVHKSNNRQVSSNVNKHLQSIDTIFNKYALEINDLTGKQRKIFESRMFHVVARAYRRNNDFRFLKYFFKSIFLKPSIRTLSLIFFH